MYFKTFIIVIVILCCSHFRSNAQQFHTDSATATFSVAAPAKTITGDHRSIIIKMDFKNGKIFLKAVVNAFTFQNSFVSDTKNVLVRQRFNSYYMESNLYPDIIFNGFITNTSNIKYHKDGSYPIHVKGNLQMHGQTRTITTEGTVEVKQGALFVHAGFIIRPTDYGVRIPAYIGDMYFKEIKVKVDGLLK